MLFPLVLPLLSKCLIPGVSAARSSLLHPYQLQWLEDRGLSNCSLHHLGHCGDLVYPPQWEEYGGDRVWPNWSSCKRVASCPTLAIDLSPSRQLLAARTTFVFFFSTLSSTSTTCDNLYFLVVGQKKYLAAAREP